jgi:hypothetical protein
MNIGACHSWPQLTIDLKVGITVEKTAMLGTLVSEPTWGIAITRAQNTRLRLDHEHRGLNTGGLRVVPLLAEALAWSHLDSS